MTYLNQFLRNLPKEDYEKFDLEDKKLEEDKLEYDNVVSQLKAISWQLKRIADALNK